MSETVTWGILGNATIARVCVIPAIAKSRNGRLGALATRRPAEAADLCRQNGIGRIYDAYDRLLADPGIDAVYIPLPNHLHCEWTLKALAAGKHVLCEKPLACSAAEAETMAAAARSAGRLLMEAYMYRFHPRSREIRRLVRSGAVGDPRLIRAAFCYRMARADYRNPHNARLLARKGGGALLDVGCYGVSLARWLFDAQPQTVQCQGFFHPAGADVHAVATLGFDDRRLAVVEASFIAGLQQTYSVVGDRGALDLPHDAFIPWGKDALFTLRQDAADHAAPTVIPGADQYQLMVEHFADAATGRTPARVSTDDSLATLRVLDALAQALRTGETVKVK